MDAGELWEEEIIIDETATKEYLQRIVEHKQKYSNKQISIIGKSGIPLLVDDISKKGDKYIIKIDLKLLGKIAGDKETEKLIRALYKAELEDYNNHPYIQIQY